MHPSNPIFIDPPNTPLRRFVVNSLVVWPMLGLYQLIDYHQSAAPVAVPMPSWVPFCPPFIIPYLGMLLTTWLLPVAIRDPARFRACLRANICGFLLVTPWWILTPTMIPRPSMPDGAWADTVGLLWMIDPPYNVMPCAHGIGPMVAAWFAIQDHPTWRWPLIAWLALGLSSVALIWQHRPIDILLGAVATAIGIAIAETLRRRERPAFRKLDETAA